MQVDRARTPWLVAGLHRQMVGPTTDPVNIETLARLQDDLEGLFLKHKVDLVLQGMCCLGGWHGHASRQAPRGVLCCVVGWGGCAPEG